MGPGPLSPQPWLDRALRDLLAAAIPELIDAARPLEPRLLLIMGSGACGEASGVPLPDERRLALSDLDLALFTERAPGAEARARIRARLAEALAPEVARLGLVRDPIELGIYARQALLDLPATIELAEARAWPRVLWGDSAILSEAPFALRARFEALRLVLNRIAEAACEASGPLARRASPWPEAPSVEDWRGAHRFAKLTIDAGKAWLTARGELEPSVAARWERLRGEGPGGVRAPDAAEALDAAAPGWRTALGAWSAWRLAPAWPPPEADPAATSALLRAVLFDLLGALAGEGFRPESDRHWRRVLAAEGGSARERLRRWAGLVGRRPRGIGLARAGIFAMRWSRAWPASLGGLAAALVWIESSGMHSDRDRARARLARRFPLCEDQRSGSGEGARAPGLWIAWLRSGGG